MARATLKEGKGERGKFVLSRAEGEKEESKESREAQVTGYKLQATIPNPQPTKPETSPQSSNEPLPSQFVEELPTNFWSTEVKIAKPRVQPESGIHHPLFAELQTLFPGKLLRIEATKPETKTGDDSKDETETQIQSETPIEESET